MRGIEKYGEQGLYDVSNQATDECDSCHRMAPGRWTTDDEEGGSEWFLCDRCARTIRQLRHDVPEPTQ